VSEGPRPVVAIVGGGFGGLSVARGLRAAPVDVVLVDRVNHHLFQPLLYQVATAALSPADIATALRTLFKAQKNATMIMDEVVQVLRAPNRLVLAGGAEQAFDFLVLAPGAGYDFFGHPEWFAHVHVLKSLDDALVIRAKLLAAFETVERRLVAGEPADPPTFAVIGGGPTGVELAGALAEMARTTMAGDFRRLDPTRTRVMLFEAGPRLLSAFPEDLADYAGRALAELGVEVRVGTAVDHIDAMGLRAGGEAYSPAAVLWCAGVRARPAATWASRPLATAARSWTRRDSPATGTTRLSSATPPVGRMATEPCRGSPRWPSSRAPMWRRSFGRDCPGDERRLRSVTTTGAIWRSSVDPELSPSLDDGVSRALQPG
jgi:NADH dehydrogenase